MQEITKGNNEIIKELLSALKNSKVYKERARIQAVYLRYKNTSRQQAADVTQLSVHSITKLLTNFKRFGIKSLLAKSHPANRRKLSETQKREIFMFIKNQSTLFTLKKLMLFIFERYNVKYKSKRSYHNLVKEAKLVS